MPKQPKPPKPLIDCIYCGLNKPSTDEHILQDALGGVDCIDTVCEGCNDHLAINDKILSVGSVLSPFASRELGGVGSEIWDIDHDRNGLLCDARMSKSTDAPVRKPQIVFDGDKHPVYFDQEDLRLGIEEIQNRLYTRLKSAYDFYAEFGSRCRKKDYPGRDMIILNQVARIRKEYRLPPRISCNKPIREWNHKALMFDLSYLTEEDRDSALALLATFDWSKRTTELQMQLGSEMPEAHIGFVLTFAMQAFAKVGFNMLAKYCKSTPVNCESFADTVGWILGKKHFQKLGDERRLGFVTPDSIAQLGCPAKSNKFRLTHDSFENVWHLYGSFFEGKAGMYVIFPGPNNESWRTMELIAPYDKPMLPPVFHGLHRRFPVQATIDPREMAPSLNIVTGDLRVDRTPVRTDSLGNII